MTWSLLLWPLVAFGGLLFHARASQGLTESIQSQRPLDGDRAEDLAERTGEATTELLESIRFGAIELLAPSFESLGDWLGNQPSDWSEKAQGSLLVRQTGRWTGSRVGLEEWIAALRRPFAGLDPWTHAKAKVIAVTPGESQRFQTTVLFDLARSAQAQCWIEVELHWQDGAALRCTGAQVLRYSRTSTSAPMFRERTRGVLQGAQEAAFALSLGGREWASRLDDGSATAWFGHQGMAVGDVDGDSRPDVYVGMPSGVPNLLLLQQADGTVSDVASDRGVAWFDDTKGVLLVDLDADGDLDLVTALNHVLVVHANDGQGNFQVVGGCPAPDEAPFYSLAAADVNGDGAVDLFATRYVRTRYGDSIPIPMEDAQNGPSNHLFLNQGGFRFVDATVALGLDAGNSRFSLAASFADYDGDGDSDLYVANDFGRNRMWRNEKGRFIDVAKEAGVEDQAAGMGVSWADYDGDGDQDLYVSNMFSSAGRRIAYQSAYRSGPWDISLEGIRRHALGNSLWRQEAGGVFRDRSDVDHVRMGRWCWGAIFTDLDADGAPDLYAPNGFMTGPEEGDL